MTLGFVIDKVVGTGALAWGVVAATVAVALATTIPGTGVPGLLVVTVVGFVAAALVVLGLVLHRCASRCARSAAGTGTTAGRNHSPEFSRCCRAARPRHANAG